MATRNPFVYSFTFVEGLHTSYPSPRDKLKHVLPQIRAVRVLSCLSCSNLFLCVYLRYLRFVITVLSVPILRHVLNSFNSFPEFVDSPPDKLKHILRSMPYP